MGLTATSSGGESFPIAPSGNHLAICYSVIDLGHQESTYQGKVNVKPKVHIGFELCHELMDDGRPFAVSGMYTISLNEKAALRAALENWRAKTFTDDELAGFDLRNILGKPCQVTVVHNESNGNTYANIGDGGRSISSVMKGIEIPAQHNPSVWYDTEEHDEEVFASLPEWIQKKIQSAKQTTLTAVPDSLPDGDFDDDIPF